MTKMKKVSLICVIIMSMSTLIIYFINCTNIKYDISDAVVNDKIKVHKNYQIKVHSFKK